MCGQSEISKHIYLMIPHLVPIFSIILDSILALLLSLYYCVAVLNWILFIKLHVIVMIEWNVSLERCIF